MEEDIKNMWKDGQEHHKITGIGKKERLHSSTSDCKCPSRKKYHGFDWALTGILGYDAISRGGLSYKK